MAADECAAVLQQTASDWYEARIGDSAATHIAETAVSEEWAVDASSVLRIIDQWHVVPFGPLLRSYLRDKDHRIRARALQTLAGLAQSPSMKDEAIALLEDANPDVRASAANACAACKYADAAPVLAKLIGDQVPTVRAAALRALAHIGEFERVSTLPQLLHDCDADVRAAAVELAAARDQMGILISASHDDDPHVRATVAKSVAPCAGDHSAVLLQQLSVDRDRDVRAAALGELWSIPNTANLALLFESLKETGEVAENAHWSLLRLFDRTALPALRRVVESDDPRVRVRALQVLGAWGLPEDLPLVRRFYTEREDVRAAAVVAAGNIGTREACADLVNFLGDDSATIRCEAVEGLARFGTRDLGHRLVRMLSDSHWSVRWRVAQALASLHATESIEELLCTTRDANTQVAINGIDALSQLTSDVDAGPRQLAIVSSELLALARGDGERRLAAAIASLPAQGVMDQLSLLQHVRLRNNGFAAYQILGVLLRTYERETWNRLTTGVVAHESVEGPAALRTFVGAHVAVAGALRPFGRLNRGVTVAPLTVLRDRCAIQALYVQGGTLQVVSDYASALDRWSARLQAVAFQR